MIPPDQRYFWFDDLMSDAAANIRGQLEFGRGFGKQKGQKTLADYLLQLPLETGRIVPYVAKVDLEKARFR
jgi:hypothetical protein